MIDQASFGRTAMKAVVVLATMLAVAACDRIKDRHRAEVWTMYQSNPFDLTARTHFATFNSRLKGEQDAGDKTPNQYNCAMAAGVLNEKASSANNGKAPVRYWCEKGKYRAEAGD